jgi:hypothetical protein
VPTKHKPLISEPESVWSTPATIMSDRTRENRRAILEPLNFYREHGRPGDSNGKFDTQIRRAEDELLAEITGILTLAAASAAEPRTGVHISTLEWIKKHPSAAQDYALPGFAEWSLVPYYQRADEDKGTYFPDVMGFVPNNFRHPIQIPTEGSIIKAASAAIDALRRARRAGRPSSTANPVVSDGLREIFLRYNEKITRHSVTGWRDKKFVQFEAGPFLDFVKAAILPLNRFLIERRLPPVTAESIVRLSTTQFLP